MRTLPLRRENGFLPDLDELDDDVALVWVNYPHNPTGAVAPREFYDELAEAAERHDFVVGSDEAYTELWFDEPPPSALQAADRSRMVVFQTLSKRSSMTGYRSGFVAGPPEIVAALKAYRPTVGTAPQEFVQRASVVAWNDERHVEETRARYRAKRDVLIPAIESRGWEIVASEATMYLWVVGPDPAALLERGIIVSPGEMFGPSGEGYVRFALVPTLEECERAAEILREPPDGRRRHDRGARPRRDTRRGEGRRRLARERGGEGGDPRVLPRAQGRADRGRAVRVPRQDPAQARPRRARRPRRAAGDGAVRLVPLARRDPDAELRQHRRLGRPEHDGRHVGDGRLVRADRRRRPSRAAASGSAASSSRSTRGR